MTDQRRGMATMNDLVEFLLARIAEDEQLAERSVQIGNVGAALISFRRPDAPTVLIIHPRRVMAECEAKRRIVELHRRVEAMSDDLDGPDEFCSTCEPTDAVNQWPCMTLRLLALPYADHPDYREGWKP